MDMRTNVRNEFDLSVNYKCERKWRYYMNSCFFHFSYRRRLVLVTTKYMYLLNHPGFTTNAWMAGDFDLGVSLCAGLL